MKRKLIATSHDAKYTYWLDSDRYVYQRLGMDGAWLGWLCSESAWESCFSLSAAFGPYSDCSAALDKWCSIKARGWRVQPARAIESDERGIGKKWEFTAWAPDAAAIENERCIRQYQLV